MAPTGGSGPSSQDGGGSGDAIPTDQVYRARLNYVYWGALLKVVRVDAGGAFRGVFLSSPTNPCPVVPYDMAGGVRGLRVTTIAVRWVATGPGRGVRVRGSEVFHRL